VYLDEVPTVHVPSPAMRAWRGLIEHRQRCVGERTRVKNGIRALLRTHGVETPRGVKLWTNKGCAWIGQLPLPTPVAAMRRDQLLDDLAYRHRKIRRAERVLQEIADRQPAVALLPSIPGVGLRTAEAFVAYVDDPDRFRSRSIGAYLGMVPRQDASASTNRLGRITREGPATVRKMLAEATWQAVRAGGRRCVRRRRDFSAMGSSFS
jgi:transposase